jgi:phage-related protein
MSSDDAPGGTIRISVYSTSSLRPLCWWGSSRADIRSWPRDAKHIAGQQLHLVQSGGEPLDWKAMPTVGLGVYEIRIRTRREHRVF